MFNILVTGSTGQLGSEIKELSRNYSYNIYFTDKITLDITDFKKTRQFLIKNNINVIINCAAYTMVEKAEFEQELANKINHLAVKNLAILSKEFNIKLIHISTDYVFDGFNSKLYSEDEITNPLNVYGQTKLDGEKAIFEQNLKNSIIIRTAWLYSYYGNNFVKTIIRLGKEKDCIDIVYDQIGTPTYAKDLAKTILDIIPLIENECVQLYHYCNEGNLSWYDFAKEIIKKSKLNCKINPIRTFDYSKFIKRPHFSGLNKSKIQLIFNIEIQHWKDGLDDCLKRLGE